MSHPPGRDPEAFAALVADVFDVAGVLRRDGERIAAQFGQTQARWQLLSVVSVGDWTVPMAADRLGISRQAVQRVANELVNDGLAAYTDNPRHRRSPFLCPTEQGRQVLGAITTQAQRHHKALIAQLDGIDLAEVHTMLCRLTAVLRSELDT